MSERLRRLGRAVVDRESAIEATIGLGLMTWGLALVSVAAACIVAGAVIFIFAVWGGRLRRWGS